MRFAVLASVLLALAGCGNWPDLPVPEQSGSNVGWPKLVPVGPLLEPTDSSGDAEGETAELRLARLNARAALLRRPVTDMDEFERLRGLLAQ
ncbi:MAG: hypothetical protein GKR98_03115 [Boseongicola sp.]|nr:MAG: hypothetical protein GKR98_03115 [Boseongicola sp.]